LKGLARDLNVASQNIAKLVELSGGEARKKNQTDAYILKPEEIFKKLEVEVGKLTSPTPVKDEKEEKKPSLVSKAFEKIKSSKAGKAVSEAFAKFKATKIGGKVVSIGSEIAKFVAKFAKIFSPANIMLVFGGISFLYVILQSAIFDPIVEAFKEFIENVGEMFGSLKEGLTTFIGNLKDSIGETVEKITSNVAEFFKPFTDKVKEIFDKIFNFVKDKIDSVKKFFGFPVEPKDEKPPAPAPEASAPEASAPKASAPEAPTPTAPTPTASAPTAPAPTAPAPAPITAPLPAATPAQAEVKAPAGGLSGVVTTQSGVDISQFNPEFEKRVAAMAADFKAKTGKPLLITSGYRSNEKQKDLYDKKVAELGGNVAAARKMVAEPMPPLGNGRGSFHLKGLAIDINSKGAAGLNVLAGPRTAPTGWLESFGLIRPVPNEDWHVQPSGTPPTADNPVKPGAPTLVADKNGKAMNVNTGEKESIGPAATPPVSGAQVAAASTDVAAEQRQQAKPSTPIIVDARTTNNMVVKKQETVVSQKTDTPSQTTADTLASMATA
jgi:DNA replication initiation complex subunit (GINS family)